MDVQWSRRGRRWVLTLFIEQEGGESRRLCPDQSTGRRAYRGRQPDRPCLYLEVSSPGLDRPLRTLADYERFHEHLVRIITMIPNSGSFDDRRPTQRRRGTSVFVEAKRVGIVPIPVTQIKHARLEIEF